MTFLGSDLLRLVSFQGVRPHAARPDLPIQASRRPLHASSDIVAEFGRLMGLSDKVIRFYTVKIDEDVDPEARPNEVIDELLGAASDPGPDPEEVVRLVAEAENAEAAGTDRNLVLDYKNPQLLKNFLTDRGKIVPARISGLSARQQRQLTKVDL